MQNIAQRRQASLQYYREQYDSSHPPGQSSASTRPLNNLRTDGEDEIDNTAVVRSGYDEVDSVQSHLMKTDITPPADQV